MHIYLCYVKIFFCLAQFMYHASGQTIQLKDYVQGDSVTTCSGGLRDNVDNYIFKTEVNFQGASLQWSRIVTFEVSLQRNTQFSFLCQVNVNSGCAVSTTSVCYCTSSSNDVYSLVINKTATLAYSNVPIRGYLINSSLYHLESEIRTIPPIYESSSRQLTVNGETLSSTTCSFKISPSNPDVKLCCSNSVKICAVKILLTGNLVASGDTCASYTANTTQIGNILDFMFKHAVCGGADELTVYTCDAIIEASSCSLSCTAWAIALSVIFYLAILVILGTGIALIVFVLKDNINAVSFKVCIGLLAVDELLDIVLIIVFSLAEPCSCDPRSGSNSLAMWQIMLTVFLVCNGVLGIAAVVVAIQHFFLLNKIEHDDSASASLNKPPASHALTEKPTRRA